MNGLRGRHDDDAATYRMPVHHRVARVRRSWWAVAAASLLGVAGAVALMVVAGTGGATADVPSSLQVGSQAAPVTVVTAAPRAHPTRVTPSTSPVAASTTTPTTARPITAPPRTPTTRPATTTTERSRPATTTTEWSRPATTTTERSPSTTATSAPLTIVIPQSKVTDGADGASGSGDGSGSSSKVGDN
ncbi:MAG: hypothetical protein HIU57_03300 [Acidobacteria bacterium]|nr:hypothetical protein [Acidobacteriota bacterium]